MIRYSDRKLTSFKTKKSQNMIFDWFFCLILDWFFCLILSIDSFVWFRLFDLKIFTVLIQNQIHATGGNFVVYIAVDLKGENAKTLGYSLHNGNSTVLHQRHQLMYLENYVIAAYAELGFLAVIHNGANNTVIFFYVYYGIKLI